MVNRYPFIISEPFFSEKAAAWASEYIQGVPYKHIVIDNFLPNEHADFLVQNFPGPEHPVWLDWKKRSPYQYGKQGPGNSSKFHMLDPMFRFALNEFNSASFLKLIENITGIDKLLPDPYFTGGGMHQILKGGILDIHTDFNLYSQLDVFRQVNVLIYLNQDWKPEYEGQLELWDASPKSGGKCIRSVAPLFNRAVIFKTDKTTFHGHPREWEAPEGTTRKSIALYYYTARKIDDFTYDQHTDFQGVNSKTAPESA